MRLDPGARVALFCASGPPNPRSVQRSLRVLREWGFHDLSAPRRRRQLFLAASDQERLEDLTWALSTPEARAAWLVRGGYGLGRLLPLIEHDRLSPRPLLGFSDATALLWALYRRGWSELVHGPNLQGLEPHCDESSRQAVRELLAGGSPGPWKGRALVGGRAEGPLVGGNLCVLASLCGTPEQFQGRGCLVLLEEVTEAPYRVDRLLTQLLHSGGLEGARGIVLGEFTDCGASRQILAVLRDRLGGLGIPVLAGVPVGHGERNHPFIYGESAELDGAWLNFDSRSSR